MKHGSSRAGSRSRITNVLLVVVACLFVIFLFLVVSFLEIRHEEIALSKDESARIAVVYALPTFHEEIVSVVACLLESLGYSVVVYIGNGLHIGNAYVPFSGQRKRLSSDFYGECVSQWVTIRPLMKLKVAAEVLVFATYPMVQRRGREDPYARAYLQALQRSGARTAVAYIAHRTNEMVQPLMLETEQWVARNRSTYLLLGEHTLRDAEATLAREKQRLGEGIGLDYFIPVLPPDFVPEPTPGAYRPTFVLQGNFGGKHAHRKDPRSVLECLRVLERQPVCANSSSSGRSSHRSSRRLLPVSSSATVYNNTLSHPIAPNLARQCRPPEGTHRVSLDLVGQVEGDLGLGALSTGAVRTLSGLAHPKYFTALAAARFMLLGIAERDYYITRATSSVPTALIARVPLVAQRDFLVLYPCLREAPVHRMIAQDTECESISAALALTPEQYAEARRETVNCSRFLWSEAQHTFRRVIEKRTL